MCHVLVIEDEPLVAFQIADIATDNGATSIAYAETEMEAVDAARARLPAVILSDVQLAEGTGPMACAAILAEHGDVPVIFITATPEACDPCHYARAILAKPIAAHLVAAAFRETIAAG